ncbi:hypothetical protein NB721_003453 [Xanthomonas sacchari]|nr:hypothetical protein [Xanthomonas sacchari]
MRTDESRITTLQPRIHSDLVARMDRHDAAGQVLVVAAGEAGRFHHPLPRVLWQMLAPAPSDRASGLKSLPQEQPSAAIGLQPIVRSCDSPIPTPESRLSVADACAGTVEPRVGTEVPPTKTAQGPRSVSTDPLLLPFPIPIPESRRSVADAAPASSDRASGLKPLPQGRHSAAISQPPIARFCDSPIPIPNSRPLRSYSPSGSPRCRRSGSCSGCGRSRPLPSSPSARPAADACGCFPPGTGSCRHPWRTVGPGAAAP